METTDVYQHHNIGANAGNWPPEGGIYIQRCTPAWRTLCRAEPRIIDLALWVRDHAPAAGADDWPGYEQWRRRLDALPLTIEGRDIAHDVLLRLWEGRS